MSYLTARLYFALRRFPSRLKRVLSTPYYGLRALPETFRASDRLRRIAIFWSVMVFDLLELTCVPDLLEGLVGWLHPALRPLSLSEKVICQSVFADSLDHRLVRLRAKSAICKNTSVAAFVVMNTIHHHAPMPEETLVHELVHVWQYQHFGLRYIPLALFAIHSVEGYDYGGKVALSEGVNQRKKLWDFNFEQQAEIISHWYALKKRSTSRMAPVPDESIAVYTHLQRQLYTPPNKKVPPWKEHPSKGL